MEVVVVVAARRRRNQLRKQVLGQATPKSFPKSSYRIPSRSVGYYKQSYRYSPPMLFYVVYYNDNDNPQPELSVNCSDTSDANYNICHICDDDNGSMKLQDCNVNVECEKSTDILATCDFESSSGRKIYMLTLITLMIVLGIT